MYSRILARSKANTEFERPTLKIEVRLSDLEHGSVEIWRDIWQAIHQPSFRTFALKFCVGSRQGMMKRKSDTVMLFFPRDFRTFQQNI